MLRYLNHALLFIYSNWKILFLIIIILAVIIIFLIWTIASFYVLKYLKKNFDENFYFNDYTDNCKKYLKLYGELPIKNIYLVRQPVGKINSLIANIVTFNGISRKINSYNTINKDNEFFPIHTSMIFEVELPNKFKKHVIIEKNNNINISTNYKKYECQDIIKLSVKKNKKNKKNKFVTINNILEKTKNRIGKEKYFNWHIYKNNCVKFSEELLISINKNNEKNRKFINKNDFFKNVNESSNFKLHIINTSINLFNFIQKIAFDSIWI
tara:strand:+ start:1094 stop:1897 length:804 start_codon:yes stop_codon:yes gene_type:complete